MLSKKIINLYQSIVDTAYKMVSNNVDMNDLTGKINYAAIFARSDEEFDRISIELKTNGTVSDIQPTGNYYLLKSAIKTKYGDINNCRVVKPNDEHKQKGYVDFEVKDYENFKSKYKDRRGFSIVENIHGIELIKLWDKDFDARVFFPKNF